MFSVWWHIFQLSHSGENLFKMQSRIFLQNSQETFVEASVAPAKKRCYLGNWNCKEICSLGQWLAQRMFQYNLTRSYKTYKFFMKSREWQSFIPILYVEKNNSIFCTILLNTKYRNETKFHKLTLSADITLLHVVRRIRCTKLQRSTDVMLRVKYTRSV